MSGKFKIAISILIIITIFILAIFMNKWFQKWDGTIGIMSFILAVSTWAFDFFYFGNENFYLSIRRLILYINPVETFWKFVVVYDKCGKCPLNLLKDKDFLNDFAQSATNAFRKQVSFQEVVANRICISIDNWIQISVRVDEEGQLSISTSKTLIPSRKNSYYIQCFMDLFFSIERILHAESSRYRMHIEFLKHNPYFGFFVRHIPADNLNEFRCAFSSMLDENSQIVATKSEIAIDCVNSNILRKLAHAYLSMSGNLITGEGQ